MKKNRWRNLFYFFRAGDKNKRKKQLENNTTKSFLNVLRECPEQLTEAFCEALGIEISKDFSDYEDFSYKNQIKPNHIEADIKYLVGISNDREEPKKVESDKAEGRVDGVIEVSGKDENLILALEVKTLDDSLSGRQLGKYKNALGVSEERLRFCQWQEIYDFFSKELEQNYLGEKERFLVSEFKEYLELMDMVPFQGFSEKACDFLENYDDRAQEEVWRGKKKLLNEVKDKIIEKDWYDSGSWEIQLKEHHRHKRRGFLKFWKSNWGSKNGVHYQLQFRQSLASEGKMWICLHVEKEVPRLEAGKFAEKLAKKIEQEKIKEELMKKGYNINEKTGAGTGFLHREIFIDFSEGNRTVNKIIDVIDELVESTGLTESVDELIKEE